MISLDSFIEVVDGIVKYHKTTDALRRNYGIDIYEAVEPLMISLDRLLFNIIPEEKVDYFFSALYDDEICTHDEFKELYYDIFSE